MGEGKDTGIDGAILDEIDLSQIKNEKLRVFLEKMKTRPRGGIVVADYTKLVFEKSLPPPPPETLPA
jgi:hypothetical protein